MQLRIAGLQMAVTTDVALNTATILRGIARAAADGARVLLTPEGSLSGYTHEFDTEAVARALRQVTNAARDSELGLALGTCFVEADGQCYNQIRFYLPDGAYLDYHSKILRCASLGEPREGEVNHFTASPLRTFDYEGVTLGGLICNDLWANPGCTPQADTHLTQQLAAMGARIVFHAVNGGRDGGEWSRVAWQYHESNLRMRARAGRIWIVTVDSAWPTDMPCSAPSGVIDPKGNWVCRADDQSEQFFVHTIELTADPARR